MASRSTSPRRESLKAESAIDRTIVPVSPAGEEEEELYFKSASPPSYLDRYKQEAEEFIKQQNEENRKVVLVTSGGTTVPLEHQTVRFIDNFSNGTRGATSAEYYLKLGYAVIFLHRQFSLLPYSRHYSHTTNCFLDYMEEVDGRVVVDPQFQDEMLHVLREYSDVRKKNLILLMPFTTVQQYLYTLKMLSAAMRPLGSRGLFYLAAAVSDFFIPANRISEHKIQSSSKKLLVDLDPVPKFLHRLVEDWAPSAMIVSFKLETDPNLLIFKAKQALERYQHQLVIGNLLSTRKKEVVFVWPNKEPEWITLTKEQQDEDIEIESLLVPKIIKEHLIHIEKEQKKAKTT